MTSSRRNSASGLPPEATAGHLEHDLSRSNSALREQLKGSGINFGISERSKTDPANGNDSYRSNSSPLGILDGPKLQIDHEVGLQKRGGRGSGRGGRCGLTEAQLKSMRYVCIALSCIGVIAALASLMLHFEHKKGGSVTLCEGSDTTSAGVVLPLTCEINELAPPNSTETWATMGGHDARLFQPVLDILQVTPPPGFASPKAVQLVFVHGVRHGGWFWHGFQKELAAVHGYTSWSFTLQDFDTKHMWTFANDLMAFVQANLTDGARWALIGHSGGGHVVQHYLLTNNLLLPASSRPVAAAILNSGALSMADGAPNIGGCLFPRVVQPLIASGVFNGTFVCNEPLTLALYFINTTVLTTVSGELLDPLQYACKQHSQAAENASTWDTWTFDYATSPSHVLTPEGAPLPLAVRRCIRAFGSNTSLNTRTEGRWGALDVCPHACPTLPRRRWASRRWTPSRIASPSGTCRRSLPPSGMPPAAAPP